MFVERQGAVVGDQIDAAESGSPQVGAGIGLSDEPALKDFAAVGWSAGRGEVRIAGLPGRSAALIRDGVVEIHAHAEAGGVGGGVGEVAVADGPAHAVVDLIRVDGVVSQRWNCSTTVVGLETTPWFCPPRWPKRPEIVRSLKRAWGNQGTVSGPGLGNGQRGCRRSG